MNSLVAFLPTAILLGGSSYILIRRNSSRDGVWVAALLSVLILAFKLFIIWSMEFVALVPVAGPIIRGLTLPSLLPEFLLQPLLKQTSAAKQHWSLLWTFLAPFGSALLAATFARVYTSIERRK